MEIIYMDGVFDLFHKGHLEALKKCQKLGNKVLIGVVSDSDCEKYKRKPIINENHRKEIIESIKYVDKVIFPAPLVITKEFIINNKITKVVHGFSDKTDIDKQKEFFKVPMNMNIFFNIGYYDKISTTSIIQKIKLEY